MQSQQGVSTTPAQPENAPIWALRVAGEPFRENNTRAESEHSIGLGTSYCVPFARRTGVKRPSCPVVRLIHNVTIVRTTKGLTTTVLPPNEASFTKSPAAS